MPQQHTLEFTALSPAMPLSQKSRLELLYLLEYFHEYNYQPNEPIEYVLTALQPI